MHFWTMLVKLWTNHKFIKRKKDSPKKLFIQAVLPQKRPLPNKVQLTAFIWLPLINHADGNAGLNCTSLKKTELKRIAINQKEMDLKKQVLDVYKLFIEDGETFLRARNLGKALRSAGKNPTDMEIHEMVNFANFHYDGFINPERFLDIFLVIKRFFFVSCFLSLFRKTRI